MKDEQWERELAQECEATGEVLKPVTRSEADIYKDALVEVTKRYKNVSMTIHETLCSHKSVPFSFCPDGICKDRRTAIEYAEIIVAGGSDGTI